MSLEIENIRPRQKSETESVQIMLSKFVRYIIKSTYPEKKLILF